MVSFTTVFILQNTIPKVLKVTTMIKILFTLKIDSDRNFSMFFAPKEHGQVPSSYHVIIESIPHIVLILFLKGFKTK